ncbi:NAD(P)H-dependent oxidoreductase [Marivita sp. XM-24bin2]|jgi:chromate reductase|uniref:NADPH-dependent FMN reductase n=1 Tax=unclassified Marivita TaxID=2632480 RepID=UPI000D7A99B8|nr:NAD(P)H-dependent oxidoreductase [Marivita sp. XM-24bin2]MCR9109563.1 NAD(P)H-dependent oxidoreductase [Paracoccaceae bacterium]PWL36806.1 MAG: NADPH-dependent FMN reductase [Marivita sp. XM-24bin2]
MADLKLVGLCGSLRKASTNRLLMLEAVRRFGEAEFIDADLRFPLYDGDLERDVGIPDEVQALSDHIATSDAVIVATPEYNKGISGVLKNALDWVSRTKGSPWADKPVALMSAAAGRAGGERTQNMARLCLTPFRPLLLTGPEVMVAATSQQWDENGRLINELNAQALDELMASLRRHAVARQSL